MSLVHLLAVVAILLGCGLLLRPLAARLRLPFDAVLLLLGFAAGNLLMNAAELGVSPDMLRLLVFYVFLPILIFATAYRINAPRLLHFMFAILILALPMAMVTMMLTAILTHYGIRQTHAFPWFAALLTGTMLIATDSRALRLAFQHLNLPEDLRTVIAGEDMLTSAVSIVLFSLLLYWATHTDIAITGADAVLVFFWNLFGGLAMGLIIGFLALLFLRIRRPAPTEGALATLLVAYLAYLAADQLAGVSGVTCVLLAALIMGRTMHQDLQATRDHFVDEFWHFNANLTSYLLYLIFGLSISAHMFQEHWLAMLIGIGAVAAARTAGLLLVMPLLTRPGRALAQLPERGLLYLTGSRGAVTVGLALSVPPHLGYHLTIEAIGFGVVLFTLLAQAPLVDWVRQRPGTA